ncbi:MAG: competence/damage-inducible protein A [Bacteroidales bacterium]
MNIEIVNIGDELLNGQVLNTNLQWLCARLSEQGHRVVSSTCIMDSKEAIYTALANFQHDILILTGGLGPTKDDITKNVLCDFFDTYLEFHKPTMEHIGAMFEKRGIVMSKLNEEQALLPSGCIPLTNKLGTAPGIWFDKDGAIFIALPGVPYEMKHVIDDEVIPRIDKLSNKELCKSTSITVANIPESTLAESLEDYEGSLPNNIALAYLPSPNYIRLRLTLTSKSSGIETNTERLNAKREELISLVKGNLISKTGETLAQVVNRKLSKQGLHLTIYDSACNGKLYKMLTEDSTGNANNISLVQHYSDCAHKFINFPETSLSIHIHTDNKSITFEVYLNSEKIEDNYKLRSDNYDLETTRACCTILYLIAQLI